MVVSSLPFLEARERFLPVKSDQPIMRRWTPTRTVWRTGIGPRFAVDGAWD